MSPVSAFFLSDHCHVGLIGNSTLARNAFLSTIDRTQGLFEDISLTGIDLACNENFKFPSRSFSSVCPSVRKSSPISNKRIYINFFYFSAPSKRFATYCDPFRAISVRNA